MPPPEQFPGTFQGRPALFRVTSVAGHVYSVDFPEHLQSWDAVDPVELFVAPVEKVCAMSAAQGTRTRVSPPGV